MLLYFLCSGLAYVLFVELSSSQLISSLPDLITETPSTQLAIIRTKKALLSAGKFTAEAIRQFAIDFGCELVKTQLGLK